MNSLPCYPFTNIQGAGVAARFEHASQFSLILNNTAALHSHTHFGPNYVMKAFVDGLEQAGVPPLAFANSPTALETVLPTLPHPPSVVVTNGEGTMHHNQKRALELLDMGAAFKARGIPTVMVNSIWQENSDAALQNLKDFDLIAVRESEGPPADAGGITWRTVIPGTG